MAELGLVHRHEMSGVLHGLFRVRYFTQDDAHIYCTPEQIEDEVARRHRASCSTSTPPSASATCTIELSHAAGEVASARTRCGRSPRAPWRACSSGEGIDYMLNPGDGAFYGPKIDFHIRDVMGRTWQCGTIQVDFAMPERLDITYTGADNEEHRPVMIHRALLGSIERFMGILIEHYGGNLPTWLAPEQVLVLPIADRHADVRARGAARRARRRRRGAPSRCTPTSTTAARASASASATRSCRRCPTSSWSATARWSRAPSACASAARTRARGRSREFVDRPGRRSARAAAAGVRRAGDGQGLRRRSKPERRSVQLSSLRTSSCGTSARPSSASAGRPAAGSSSSGSGPSWAKTWSRSTCSPAQVPARRAQAAGGIVPVAERAPAPAARAGGGR